MLLLVFPQEVWTSENLFLNIVSNNTAQQKKLISWCLGFRPVPGVIWGADSENCIGSALVS